MNLWTLGRQIFVRVQKALIKKRCIKITYSLKGAVKKMKNKSWTGGAWLGLRFLSTKKSYGTFRSWKVCNSSTCGMVQLIVESNKHRWGSCIINKTKNHSSHKLLKCPLGGGTILEGNHCYINTTKKKRKLSWLRQYLNGDFSVPIALLPFTDKCVNKGLPVSGFQNIWDKAVLLAKW